MVDQTVIKYYPNGPEDRGLSPWEEISDLFIKSGTPVQRGLEYFSTANGKLTSGVWDCTAHELNPEPYEVDEFMIVLEGSVHIDLDSGGTETFKAGESFVIPNGLPCSWRQSEYIRKYFVILESSSIDADSNTRETIRVNPSADLPKITTHDATQYLSDVPDMGWLTLYKDASAQLEVGVWDCSPMKRVAVTIARNELMHILEGSGSITNADGVVFEFSAGDTFLVPIGMGYQWENSEYVKKVFCSFTLN